MKLSFTVLSLLLGASAFAQLPNHPSPKVYASNQVFLRPVYARPTNRPDSLVVVTETNLLRALKDSLVEQTQTLLQRTERIHSQDRVLIDELTQTILTLRDRLGQTGKKRP